MERKDVAKGRIGDGRVVRVDKIAVGRMRLRAIGDVDCCASASGEAEKGKIPTLAFPRLFAR